MVLAWERDLQAELGVVDLGELVDFLFELFVVEMAAAGKFLDIFP